MNVLHTQVYVGTDNLIFVCLFICLDYWSDGYGQGLHTAVENNQQKSLNICTATKKSVTNRLAEKVLARCNLSYFCNVYVCCLLQCRR